MNQAFAACWRRLASADVVASQQLCPLRLAGHARPPRSRTVQLCPSNVGWWAKRPKLERSRLLALQFPGARP